MLCNGNQANTFPFVPLCQIKQTNTKHCTGDVRKFANHNNPPPPHTHTHTAHTSRVLLDAKKIPDSVPLLSKIGNIPFQWTQRTRKQK